MQRATAHRSKPGDNWQELLDTLSTTTFFLVARAGPTVFNVRDEEGKIFKVMISNPHSCTCSSESRGNLCIHQVFVLLKVLKVSQTHPLSFQTSLTDSEISLVLSGSCGVAVSAPRVTSSKRQHSSKKLEGAGSDDGFVHRQELDEDGYIQCPICQDDMSRDQALTWCRRGCGNNIHAKCMQNYSQYKISNKEAAGCPLCRVEWALDLLKGDCRGQASLKNSCSPVYCSSCTFPQRAQFNRCIECSQSNVTSGKKPVDFCARCYTSVGKEHSTHHFLGSDASVAESEDIQWLPVANPRSLPQVIDRDTLAALQQRELSVEDYDTLLDLDKNVPDLPTQLILSLSEEKGTDRQVGTSPCWCRHKTQEAEKIRILPCKHTCHESCLRSSILEAVSGGCCGLSALLCAHPECGSKVYPGLNRRRKKKPAAAPAAAVTGGDEVATDGVARVLGGVESVGLVGLAVSGVSRGVGARPRGGLRTGVLRRPGSGVGSGVSSSGASTAGLGVEGSGISVTGIVHESRESVGAVRESSPSLREGREGRRTTGSRIQVASERLDGDQDMSLSASSIALSSSSSTAHFNVDSEQQRLARADSQPAPRRISRPPRPRPPSGGVIDVVGLDIQGRGSGLAGIALGGRAGRGAELLLSSTAPMSTEHHTAAVGDATERPRSHSVGVEERVGAQAARRLELSRSAGNLRDQRDRDSVSAALPLLGSSSIIAVSGSQLTSASSDHVEVSRAILGRMGVGADTGSDFTRSRVGGRIRSSVGIALRDAVISDGNPSLHPPLGAEEMQGLSLILNINGRSKARGASPSTRTTAAVHKGRPSPYRPVPPPELDSTADHLG